MQRAHGYVHANRCNLRTVATIHTVRLANQVTHERTSACMHVSPSGRSQHHAHSDEHASTRTCEHACTNNQTHKFTPTHLSKHTQCIDMRQQPYTQETISFGCMHLGKMMRSRWPSHTRTVSHACKNSSKRNSVGARTTDTDTRTPGHACRTLIAANCDN